MSPNGRTGDGTAHTLLDLQKFMPNKRLDALTTEVGRKYGLNGGRRVELSDDEMEVWAAGDWASGIKLKKSPGETDE